MPRKYLVRAWFHYEKTGQFPDGRCLDDQPERLLQDFAMLDTRYADIAEKMRDDEAYLPPTLTQALEPAEPVTPQKQASFAELMGLPKA